MLTLRILTEASHEFAELLGSFFFHFLSYVEIYIFRNLIISMPEPIHDLLPSQQEAVYVYGVKIAALTQGSSQQF
ncbi:hypothetical protein [Rossellomorea sp. DUT-2]|uniref:hypothetical protein n=1 Tax=Rossellomorea sp. DUT-2 TaxID=3412021 RepID=UPI003D17DAAD